MTDSPHSPEVKTTRRRFFKEAAGAAVGACLLGSASGLIARSARAMPGQALRPPGAKAEIDFLGACVRCGLCVEACPYHTLKLSSLGEDVPVGTPFFNARSIPCEMCEDIPCVKICPTGALEHSLTNINQARMGLAVLIDQENCLNFLGLRCDVCYRVCPVIDKAITLEKIHNPRSDRHAMLLPTVHADACTGCGKCEKACVLPGESAIKVLPRSVAQASVSEHYRRGWEEKRKAGGALIGEQTQLPVRGLENAQPGVDSSAVPTKPAQDLPSGWTP